jgi:GT2 family glycosyltransferase
MRLTIVIPAYNEERYLAQTLRHVHRAREYLAQRESMRVDVLVVDNASTDRTESVARSWEAEVVREEVHNIAKVRNTGAGFKVCYLRDIQVRPSCRRFDQWSIGRTLFWTNPVFILLFARWKSAWRGWYRDVPR